MDGITNLWKRLADGSLCREHPVKVWGVSLVLAGGIAFAVHAALASDTEPTEAQAAFDAGKAGTSAGGKGVARVPNTTAGIAKAAGTLGKQLAASPLLAAFAKQDLDDAGRAKAANWLYSTILKATAPNASGSLTLQTEDASSVGIWFPPGTSFDTGDFVKSGGMWYTMMFSGWERRQRFPMHGQVLATKRRTLLRKFPGGAYYLMAAGAASGKEEDVADVIAPVLALADAAGVPAITESDTPARKALLTDLGFTAVDSVAALKVNVEIMLRAPASA